ncbi:MAG: homocysteine S-methyltransferase family protein [Candidatus Azotimanducaceae bacterium]|jgi:S-methylmethionine-dependent homocysteine/selenocysteine methylase
MSEDLTILDGGMGGELIRRGWPSGGLWSAKALLENPEVVRAVHQDYVSAGAQVIITNSYSTVPSYLAKEDMQSRYVELTEIAARLAREVADAAPAEVRVAGCLPPLSESYRPDLVPGDDESRPIYSEIIKALSADVDLYLCETMSSVREAVNAASSVRETDPDKPLWVALTLADEPGGGLRSGENMDQVVSALEPYDVDAFLFNCTDPTSISVALEELVPLTNKPTGAYPNRFHVPPGWTLDNEIAVEPTEMTVEDYLGFVDTWRRSGATIIGGCCGVGPEFIAALSS